MVSGEGLGGGYRTPPNRTRRERSELVLGGLGGAKMRPIRKLSTGAFRARWLSKGYPTVIRRKKSRNILKLIKNFHFFRSHYPVNPFPLSRQSVPTIPSIRSHYPVNPFPLSRAFRLARAVGSHNFSDDVARLARRVVDRDPDGVLLSFIV